MTGNKIRDINNGGGTALDAGTARRMNSAQQALRRNQGREDEQPLPTRIGTQATKLGPGAREDKGHA